MAVSEGLDIDDDLLTHLKAAFERGRPHMRQQNDIRQFAQTRVQGGPVFIDVKTRARDFPRPCLLYTSRCV